MQNRKLSAAEIVVEINRHAIELFDQVQQTRELLVDEEYSLARESVATVRQIADRLHNRCTQYIRVKGERRP